MSFVHLVWGHSGPRLDRCPPHSSFPELGAMRSYVTELIRHITGHGYMTIVGEGRD